jgi:hypothetical protein
MKNRRMFLAKCLILAVFILFGNSAFAADENKSADDIEPGLGFKTADFIAHGISLEISEDDSSIKNTFCRPERVIFCIEKDGKLGCMKWVHRVSLTFVPKNGLLEFPLVATGYSSDKDQLPEKEYRLIPCGDDD